jgi:hypothetical protein
LSSDSLYPVLPDTAQQNQRSGKDKRRGCLKTICTIIKIEGIALGERNIERVLF